MIKRIVKMVHVKRAGWKDLIPDHILPFLMSHAYAVLRQVAEGKKICSGETWETALTGTLRDRASATTFARPGKYLN